MAGFRFHGRETNHGPPTLALVWLLLLILASGEDIASSSVAGDTSGRDDQGQVENDEDNVIAIQVRVFPHEEEERARAIVLVGRICALLHVHSDNFFERRLLPCIHSLLTTPTLYTSADRTLRGEGPRQRRAA